MKICRFNEGRVGVVLDESVADITDTVLGQLAPVAWPAPRGDRFIADLPALQPLMAEAAATAPRVPLAEVSLACPVANPGKIICAPVNYQRHLDESRADAGIHHGSNVGIIDQYGVFLKATSSVVGPGQGIALPPVERRIDHEVELALVIGEGGRDIAQDRALDHVAGYMIGLDITVRGTEDRSYRKSFDTFGVFGPFLVTADAFGDPDGVGLELRVNGELRQAANTRDLVWSVPRLIAYASAAYVLEPGDIIMTGTPEGVGPICHGDMIDCAIDRIGSMRVAVSSR